jgi:hypothetical protein
MIRAAAAVKSFIGPLSEARRYFLPLLILGEVAASIASGGEVILNLLGRSDFERIKSVTGNLSQTLSLDNERVRNSRSRGRKVNPRDYKARA